MQIPKFENLKELCVYISERHHAFVVQESAEILLLLRKVSNVDSQKYPELDEAESLLTSLFKDLKAHLDKEETILFPLIKYLEDCKKFKEKPHLGKNKPMKKTIAALETDHLIAETITEKLKNILFNYATPAEASATYKLFLQRLEDFEKDLQTHIHLENNMLFPKAVELENYLYNTY